MSKSFISLSEVEAQRLHRSLEEVAQAYETGDKLPSGSSCIPIYMGRNRLYRIRLSEHGVEYALKCFAPLGLLRRLYYSYIGSTKAERSYRYATTLIDLGVCTPSPLGYSEHRSRFGIVGSCFYSCLHYAQAEQIHADMRGWSAREGFLEELSSFLIQLHKAGVEHLDLSPGNVLYISKGSAQVESFCLVDLNRMKLHDRSLTFEEVVNNMSRLSVSRSVTRRLARYYAESCGWSVEAMELALGQAVDAFWLGRIHRLARRYYLKEQGNRGWIFFEIVYLAYLTIRCLRRLLSRFSSLSSKFFAWEEKLYHRYLEIEDIRDALRQREGYSYTIHHRE